MANDLTTVPPAHGSGSVLDLAIRERAERAVRRHYTSRSDVEEVLAMLDLVRHGQP